MLAQNERLLAPIYYPINCAAKYRLRLKRLIADIERRVLQRFEEANPIDYESYLRCFDRAFNHYLADFNLGHKIALDFVASLGAYHNRQFFTSTREVFGFSLRKALNQLSFNVLMRQAINENVALIKSIPKELHQQIQQVITEAFSTAGFDQGAIMDLIKDRFKVANSRAKLIARDQTNKTISHMTQLRHEQLGIDDYVWLGVDDERERPEHVANNDQRFSYSAPPETGHPGEAINCRCVSVGIITSQTFKNIDIVGEISDETH